MLFCFLSRMGRWHPGRCLTATFPYYIWRRNRIISLRKSIKDLFPMWLWKTVLIQKNKYINKTIIAKTWFRFWSIQKKTSSILVLSLRLWLTELRVPRNPNLNPDFLWLKTAGSPLKNLPRRLFTISLKWVREKGKWFPGLSGGSRSFPCPALMWRYLPSASRPRTCENTRQVTIKKKNRLISSSSGSQLATD